MVSPPLKSITLCYSLLGSLGTGGRPRGPVFLRCVSWSLRPATGLNLLLRRPVAQAGERSPHRWCQFGFDPISTCTTRPTLPSLRRPVSRVSGAQQRYWPQVGPQHHQKPLTTFTPDQSGCRGCIHFPGKPLFPVTPWSCVVRIHVEGKEKLYAGDVNLSEKYLSLGMTIPYIWKNKKCFKPPTRNCYRRWIN